MSIIWTPGELARLQKAVDEEGISVAEAVRRIKTLPVYFEAVLAGTKNLKKRFDRKKGR